MYRVRKLWLRFRSHLGMYIYAGLQFVVILYIASMEVSSLREDYHMTYFVKEYGDDMHLYASVMNKIMEGSADDNVEIETQDFINKIEAVEGVKGVGYNINLHMYELFDGNGEESIVYLNDIMSSITYNRVEGSWLTEVETVEDYINVVVGSELGKQYNIGDTFVVEKIEADVAYTCKVIGVLGEGAGIVYLNRGGSMKMLPQSYNTDWEIYTNDERILKGIDSSEYIYPSENLLLSLEEGYDEEELLKYGNIYSLQYLENCSDDYFSFAVNTIFDSYGVLIFVILFGAFGMIYLILSKGMYTNGVFSILGMTKVKMVMETLVIHVLIYLSAVITVCIAYGDSSEVCEIWGENPWTSWHTAFAIILGIMTSLITAVTSVCMIQKNPKDIMRMAKNMEG